MVSVRIIRYLVISISAALAVLNLGVSLFNFADHGKLMRWMTHAEGSLYFQLGAAHWLLAFLFIVLAVVHSRTRARRFEALVASLGIVSVYVWWFFEKFMFLNGQGLKPGTEEYETLLGRFETFREATLVDHIAIPLTLIVIALVCLLQFRNTPCREKA